MAKLGCCRFCSKMVPLQMRQFQVLRSCLNTERYFAAASFDEKFESFNGKLRSFSSLMLTTSSPSKQK